MKRACHAHPKLYDLADALGVSKTHAVGILESLWHLTSTQRPHGDIGALTNRQIARALDWPDPDRLIRALTDTRWIDEHPTYRLVVHDWHIHCDDTTEKAVRRSGRGFSSSGETISGKVEKVPDKTRLPEPCLSQSLALPEPEPKPEPPPAGVCPTLRVHSADPDRAAAIRHAVNAVDRWAESSRGSRLEPARNETQVVEQQCETWGDSPPIVHGSQPVSPLSLVPEAVRRVMAGKNPPRFKHVKFAIGCIDNALDEMRRFGTSAQPPPGSKPPRDYSALKAALEAEP
jgi:hypothetical protein